MTEIQKKLKEENYNKYISDLAGGDIEYEEQQANQRRQLLQEMKDKDE
jgi:DNA-dependent RNA polymerase auxiliary subunit epsilon